MKHAFIKIMIFTMLAMLISIQVQADLQRNPYSQYGYGSYSIPNNDSSAADEQRPQSCSDPNWDSGCLCEQQRQKIEWVRNQGQPIVGFDWSRIRSQQLVIMGDAHGVSNPDSILDLINLSRSESRRQCVFFEMSSDWSVEEFLNILRERTGNPETDLLRRYYSRIANGAISNGFTLHMVDDPRNFTGDRTVSDLDREAHMASRIKDLFEARRCDHAIFVVGKAHVSGSYLPSRLRQLGISLTTLNPIHAPSAGRTRPTEEWNGLCESQTYTPSEPLIFANSGIRDSWITPGFTAPLYSTRFGSFDYSILFPEAQFERGSRSSPSQPAQQGLSGVR